MTEPHQDGLYLHDRATRGEPLSAAEQARLHRWYGEQDRAEVLQRLLAKFEEPPDAELDQLWAQEAEDRPDAFDRGELGSVSGEEVFARIERQRAK